MDFETDPILYYKKSYELTFDESQQTNIKKNSEKSLIIIHNHNTSKNTDNNNDNNKN